MELEKSSPSYKEPTPEEKAKKEKEANEPTIPDIRKDAKKAGLFHEFLLHTGDPDDTEFAERWNADGDLTNADFRRAETRRKEFLLRTEQIEKMQALLTPEFLQELPQKDLQAILKTTGAAKVKGVLARDLEVFAMKGPAGFKQLHRKAESYAGHADKKREKEKKLGELAKKYTLKEEALEKMFQEPDPIKRNALVEKFFADIIKNKKWFFRRSKWDTWKTQQINDLEADILAETPQIEKLLKDLNDAKRVIGGGLAASLIGNSDLNASLLKAFSGEDLQEKEWMEPEDFKKQVPPRAKAQEEFDKFKKSNGITNWDSLIDSVKDSRLEEFGKNLSGPIQKKFAEKRGGLAELLFGDNFWKMIVKGYRLS